MNNRLTAENNYIKKLLRFPGALLLHRDGKILFANDNFSKISGYSAGEVIKKNIFDFLTAASAPQFETALKNRRYLKGYELELEIICKNGRSKFIGVKTGIIDYGGGKAFISTINDITEKKEFENILDYSENKFKSLFGSLNEAVFIIETESGIIIDANAMAESMLGRRKKDIVGMHYSMLHPPEEKDNYVENFSVLKECGPAPFYKKVTAMDGRIIEVEISASCVLLSPEIKVFQGIYHDITERKKYERQLENSLHEKEILLKEVHHRVKNNLQIISSLFNMQLKNVKNEESISVIREAAGRIRSIALIHEKLYRSDNFSVIDFSEFIRDIINHISRCYYNESRRIIFHYSLEYTGLNLERCMALSLIVNEIITNSLKYAFPEDGSKEGNIFVFFAKDKISGDYKLALSDDGRGFKNIPDPLSRASFGIGLVFDLVKEIGGRVLIKNDPGACYEITFR